MISVFQAKIFVHVREAHCLLAAVRLAVSDASAVGLS